MDMLFTRYACPFPMLDQMIDCGRFTDYIYEFLKIRRDEEYDKAMWEMYLHHEMLHSSFDDFKKRCFVSSEEKEQREIKLGTTLKNSKQMLMDFVPED